MGSTTPLTGHKISLSYEPLLVCPTMSSGILYNGDGNQVYTNSDSIGTVKMFYPISGTVGTYFDESTGLGIGGGSWENWGICDGRNGTPDLRGRFIVGYDNGDVDYSIGATGGGGNINIGKQISLNVSNLPPHTHTLTTSKWGISSVTDGSKWADQGSQDHDEAKTTSSGDGYSNPFENRPSYYTLLYAIKIF